MFWDRYIEASMRVAKTRPATIFEAAFFDTKEKIKAIKNDLDDKAVAALQKTLFDDLKARGVRVLSGEMKLGKFRGSSFITSFKLEVAIKTQKDAENLTMYLRGKYSPKWQLKDFQNGIAHLNVR